VSDPSSAPPTFDRRDPPTSEVLWCAAPQWEDTPVLSLDDLGARWGRIVIASAHPDDETLGTGALAAELADRGLPVTVVVATAGEKSHDIADERGRSRLADRRRREVVRAVATLAPQATVVQLTYPDTDLESSVEAVSADLAAHLDAHTLLLAPWLRDGHADHDALGRAAVAAGVRAEVAVAFYPVWLWHWSTPAELDWHHLVAVEPSPVALRRKRAALECFSSQTTAWDPDPGRDDPAAVLDVQAMARARRPMEALFDPDGVLPRLPASSREHRNRHRAAVFDDMYRVGADAWATQGSFYERRRRDLVMALLGRPSYPRALEVGCANGYLTSALCERVGHLSALDVSGTAVAHARALAPAAHIRVGAAPGDLPRGPFELVVLSEIGYFLTPLEWLVTLQRARACLAPEGELVLCHWQRPTVDIPLDGPLVHEHAHHALGEPDTRYADADLSIETWTGAPSVAQREGRESSGADA